MNITDDEKEKLINKYNNSLFMKEDVDLSLIDPLIDDDDLRKLAWINNEKMKDLINEKVINEETIKPLFFTNLNLYRLAHEREISIPYKSFMVTVAISIDYNFEKYFDVFDLGFYRDLTKISL